MTVRYLYECVAGILQCDPVDFHLLVQREHLWHSGRITDRQDPVTMQPTCFLVPRSVVTVRMMSTFPYLSRPDETVHTSGHDVDDSHAYGDGGDLVEDLDPADSSSLHNAPEDPELLALFHQLADLNDLILARWVVLLSFALSNDAARREAFEDDDALDDSHSGGGSSSSNHGTSIRGDPVPPITSTKPSSSHIRDRSLVDSSSLSLPNTTEVQRRASTIRPAPRIPYASGSGGGLASKDHDRHLVRRPANQRWFYDL